MTDEKKISRIPASLIGRTRVAMDQIKRLKGLRNLDLRDCEGAAGDIILYVSAIDQRALPHVVIQ